MNGNIERRIADFRDDLSTRTTSYMIRYYTTFGTPQVIDRLQYFDLKSSIADHFDIHPSEVIMVGSAKLGFSIKPDKRYVAFGEESDIDMAIVSPNLFDRIWLEVLKYSQSNDMRYFQKKQEFQDYLFRGWIRPDKLPQGRSFQIAQDWWGFFRNLTHKQASYKITGGLYKSWYHFEWYQSLAVDACKQSLESE